MGRVIAIGAIIVTIALIVAWVMVYFRRRRSKETALEHGWAVSGDLNHIQEQALINQNNAAHTLLQHLLEPPRGFEADSWTILSTSDRARIQTWIGDNAHINQKGITR